MVKGAPAELWKAAPVGKSEPSQVEIEEQAVIFKWKQRVGIPDGDVRLVMIDGHSLTGMKKERRQLTTHCLQRACSRQTSFGTIITKGNAGNIREVMQQAGDKVKFLIICKQHTSVDNNQHRIYRHERDPPQAVRCNGDVGDFCRSLGAQALLLDARVEKLDIIRYKGPTGCDGALIVTVGQEIPHKDYRLGMWTCRSPVECSIMVTRWEVAAAISLCSQLTTEDNTTMEADLALSTDVTKLGDAYGEHHGSTRIRTRGEEPCGICFDPMGTDMITICCGKVAHSGCWKRCIKQKNSCPWCPKIFTATTHMRPAHTMHPQRNPALPEVTKHGSSDVNHQAPREQRGDARWQCHWCNKFDYEGFIGNSRRSRFYCRACLRDRPRGMTLDYTI